MNKKFELLREAVGCYKANHVSGCTNEKALLEFIDELEQENKNSTMGIIDKAFKELDPERERLMNELIDTIEKNAVDNKVTITNVKLWCLSWRGALDLFSEKGCKYVKRKGESCTLNDNCTYPNCP